MVDKANKLAGRYLIDQKIASGGMGGVFEATDDRLGRKVAVKMLKDELAENPAFVERFRREARAVATLSHPNVAGVYDYGEDAAGHFIVMEYARGRDLARLLREEAPLSEERAARIAAQVCDALGHAHAAGVIHRDIKPANIIVGDDDRVKVTDFGIARAAGDSSLTVTGSVLGTVHYISPEQAGGKGAGPASDLYSAGIVLYEMLTGALPFTGDTPVAIAMRHVSDDVPSPSELNPRVSTEMDRLVARATAKAPEERFSSADEMAAALRGVAPGPTAPMGATAALAGATRALGDTRPVTQRARPAPQRARGAPSPSMRRGVIFALGLLAVIAALWLISSLGDEQADIRAPATPVTGAEEETAPQSATVPAVRGLSYELASNRLEARGLDAQRDEVESSAPRNVVTGSSPAAGTSVPSGSTVTLFVSQGPQVEQPEEEEQEERAPAEAEETVENPGKGNGKGNGKSEGKND